MFFYRYPQEAIALFFMKLFRREIPPFEYRIVLIQSFEGLVLARKTYYIERKVLWYWTRAWHKMYGGFGDSITEYKTWGTKEEARLALDNFLAKIPVSKKSSFFPYP